MAPEGVPPGGSTPSGAAGPAARPSPLARAGRFWRTVRHLRPVQVYGRVWFRLHRPRPDLSPAPPLAPAASPWTPPARREPSLLGPDRLRFLNEEATLAEGWDPPARSHLWRYNLHYFDDLTARGAESREGWHRALLAAWIAANPPGQGTGWEPYPTSLRLVNWTKRHLAGHPLPPEALHSLAVQARWLSRRLERHLGGNHLVSNAKALLFAGALLDGPEAASWRRRALAILARELPRQILPDGGHFELSPMYHALAVEDLLDLLNLAAARPLGPQGARQAEDWRARLPAMLAWLQALSHPDGRIAFFNDAAFGIAPANDELLAYAARLGLAPAPIPTGLLASGYARLARGDALLLADLAPIGPDHLPGHAHADTLSFELSLGPHRVIVNSGTSVYGTGPERLRQRGTPAHSTVALPGLDSSEVWGGFRVGRRARIREARAEDGPTARATGTQDGYAHLPGRPLHRRSWDLTDTGLTVTDRLPAEGAEARFHLHPAVTADPGGTLRLPDGRTLQWTASGPARLEPSSWHPEFGLSMPSACLVLPLQAGESSLTLSWA